MPLGIERIAIPEILFHPSDIGMPQMGIAEGIVQAVQSCPEAYRGGMYANIVLTGGSTKFPNFAQRLAEELRPLVPIEFKIHISSTKE